MPGPAKRPMSPVSSAMVSARISPDAADGLEPLEVLAQLDLGQDAALKLDDLAVDAVHHRQVRLHGLLVLVEQFHGVDALGIPALDLVAAGARAEVARNQVFNAQDLRAALTHELAALAQQVAHGAFLPGVDIPHGQDAQPQQVGQVARVAEIASMLEPVVLLDRGGVDQMHGEASGLKAVNQPVPVERGLHRHAAHLAGAGAQRSHDGSTDRWAIAWRTPFDPARRARSRRCCCCADQSPHTVPCRPPLWAPSVESQSKR